MLNKTKIQVIEILEDNKVKVLLNNKTYIRAVKKTISNQKYVVINKNEYLI